MKIETVVDPNDHILGILQRYLEIVKNTLPGRLVEAVGSMAVPMAGRSELDILVITEAIESDTEILKTIGFDHRGFADGASYLKQEVEGVDVTVQVMKEENPLVVSRRKMITLLREDSSLRNQYEVFKKSLSGLDRYEYRKKKVEWMEQNILPKMS